MILSLYLQFKENERGTEEKEEYLVRDTT